MRCTIFSLATLFIISLSAFAAPQNKEPQRKRLSEIPKELNLSAEQQKQLDALNAEFKAKMEEFKKSMDELKSKQGEWKGMADEHQKAIKELLTPEQMQKWKDMMPQMGKLRQFDSRKREFVTPDGDVLRYRGRDFIPGDSMKFGHHRRGFAPGDSLMQGSWMRGKGDRFSGLNLSDEQKIKLKALREEHRKKIGEMNTRHRAEMEKILTPEQLSKLKESQPAFDRKQKGNASDSVSSKGKKVEKNVQIKVEKRK